MLKRPFLVVFFVLAGASLELDALLTTGLLGGGYVLLRIAAKILKSSERIKDKDRVERGID